MSAVVGYVVGCDKVYSKFVICYLCGGLCKWVSVCGRLNDVFVFVMRVSQ